MEEYKEQTEDQIVEKSRKREDWFRCRVCKMLWEDERCLRDPITQAYICPNGCEKAFEQEEYELPTDS